MVPLILVLCVRALHISLLYLLHAFIQAIQRLRKGGVLDQIRPGSWEEKLVSHEWDVGLFRCRLFGYYWLIHLIAIHKYADWTVPNTVSRATPSWQGRSLLQPTPRRFQRRGLLARCLSSIGG